MTHRRPRGRSSPFALRVDPAVMGRIVRSARAAGWPGAVPMALPLMLAMGGACAQSAPGRTYGISTNAGVELTATDNAQLTADREADLITRTSVGVSAFSAGGRVRGSLDYTLSSLLHTSNSSRNEIQHALSAAGTAELVERRFFVDMGGSVAQQAISAFGQQSVDSSLGDRNRAQVASFRVSPYLRGTLGPLGYEARWSGAHTATDSGAASDSTTTASSLHLDSGSSGTWLGWSVDASRQTVDYSLGARNEADRIEAALSYAVSYDLNIAITGGGESNNYVSPEKQSHGTVGARVNWRPSERTSLFASYSRRFFGSSHSVQFSYRTARTAWIYSDSRDTSTNPSQTGVTIGTAYDLYNALLTAQQPDPVLRDALVRALLAQGNVDPTARVTSGYVPASVALLSSRSLSFVLMGLRNTLTLRALSTDSRRLNDGSGVGLGIAGDPFRIRQSGFIVDVAHRLTPISSVSASASLQRSRGDSTTPSTSLSAVSVNFSQQFSPRINGTAGLRHSRFDSAASPYDENAVFANVRVRF